MVYFLVRFTDGIYHVACEKELKNKYGNEASVYWKPTRSYYLAEILAESSNEKTCRELKDLYEKGESKYGAKSFDTPLAVENSDAIPIYNGENREHRPNEPMKNIEAANMSEKSIFEENNNQILNCPNISENKLIWDELQCGIPYEDILNIEEECNGKTEQSENAKINIISVDIIPPSTKKVQKTKYIAKQQYCLYCRKLVNKFARHLLLVHKMEEKVKEIISLEKQTDRRRKLINELRNKGNYMYNHEGQASCETIVARRPINKQRPMEYLDCPNCLIRISKVSLRRHVLKCKSDDTKCRTTMTDSKRVTFDVHKIADPILRNYIFPVLKNDIYTQVIRKDYLTNVYGNKLVAKYSSSHHHKMIRANLRYIGKYLVEMRKLSSEISDFQSCFAPSHYDNSVKAIRIVAKYDEENREYNAPYSASALGTILKFCCAILEGDLIKKNNTEKIPEVQNFLKLLQTELCTDVNKTVIENLTSIRRSKKVILPSMSDMTKLTDYLRSKRNDLFVQISHEFSHYLWKKISAFTVVGVMVYNGRRPGEIQRILIKDFMESSQSTTDNPEIFSDANPNDKNFTRCVLRGKLGRNVSIVLNNEDVECVRYILEYRHLAGVSSDNPYVFGLPGNQRPFKFLNAGILLKKFATDAGVQHPNRFYATNIRKNLATRVSKLSLNPDEQEHVMNFMGHSEKIHKTIYRQPDMEKDIMIMPKILDFASGQHHSKDISFGAINTASKNYENDTSKHEEEACGSDEYVDYDQNITPSKENQSRRKRRLIDMSLGYIPRKSWSTEEREAATLVFKENISTEKSPDFESCKNVTKTCPALRSRTAAQLKAWVNNQIKKKNETEHGKEIIRRTWSTPEKKLCRQLFGEDVERGVYPSRTRICDAIKKYPQLQTRTPDMIVAHLQHALKKNKNCQ